MIILMVRRVVLLPMDSEVYGKNRVLTKIGSKTKSLVSTAILISILSWIESVKLKSSFMWPIFSEEKYV